MKLQAYSGQSGPHAFVQFLLVSDDGQVSDPKAVTVTVPCHDYDHAVRVAKVFNREPGA